MLATRAYRRHPFGGVRRLCRRKPGDPHRRCATEGDDHRRRGHARRQDDSLQAAGRRSHRARQASAAARVDRRPRARSGNDACRGPRSRLRHAARADTWTRTCPACGWNPPSRRTSCTRRARPASPRACSAIPAAMRWRWRHPCATSTAGARRDDVLHQRHRLGGRAFLHRLRAADQRLRRPIMYEGLPIRPDPGDLVEDRRGVQGALDVHLAHRDPRAEEAGPGVHAAARPVVAALPVPRGRAAGRADRALGVGALRRGHRRQLLADRDRAGRSCRRNRASRTRRASSAARRLPRRATTCGCCTR